MCPGYRRIEHKPIDRFVRSIQVTTYPSGERRIGLDPHRSVLQSAFDELGTLTAVARAFDVSRAVVERWVSELGMEVTSRPEVGLASYLKQRLVNDGDKRTIAQWLMDEGSVSVAYFRRGDYTMLIVCGSMNDYQVLSELSRILETTITSSKAPGPSTLPMGALRVQSARAYALLSILETHLVGLKAMEAKEALQFFPPSGILRGRHTTDEFLVKTWRAYAKGCYFEWNKRRRIKSSSDDMERLAAAWVEGRIRRARRFIDRSPR